MKIHPLSPGQIPKRDDYNKLAKAVNGLMNMKGRNGITVRTSPFGTTLIGSGAASAVSATTTGTELRKAYAINDATATDTIKVRLDFDLSGSDSATAFCHIVGGNHLNAAIPRLEQSDLFYVAWDKSLFGGVSSGWRSVMTFQSTVDCS